MIRHHVSLLAAIVFAGAVSTAAGMAATCTPGSGTVTCTGGAGVTVNVTGDGTTKAGSPFPSTINVTGGGAAVSTISVTLHGYTSMAVGGSPSYAGSRDLGLMLVAPDGTNFELLHCVGQPFANSAFHPQTNLTVTLQDGATVVPSCNPNDSNFAPWTTGGTFSPSSNINGVTLIAHADYAQAGGPALQANHYGHNNGTDTLYSV